MGKIDKKQGYRHPGTTRLTPRQTQILELIKLGWTDKAIGIKLGVTEFAISNRISHGILSRLGASNRAHAVYLGLKYNLIGWSDEK
jgi:DNA-binding NarL/FixJ family response regulator